MKLGTLILAAALGAASALPFAVPALAQNVAVIKERQESMKAVGQAAKTAGTFLKGEAPFDAAKAAALFAAMDTTAKKYGTLFPEDSKIGEDTEAAPAIWEKPQEFQTKVAEFEADISAAIAANPQDLEAFKASFGAVAANCKGCHEEFRVDK